MIDKLNGMGNEQMKNYAKDIHRKGKLHLYSEMDQLADTKIKGKDMGTAFVTEGYEGYDAICLIANKPEFVKDQGYIVYDMDAHKAKFVKDGE